MRQVEKLNFLGNLWSYHLESADVAFGDWDEPTALTSRRYPGGKDFSTFKQARAPGRTSCLKVETHKCEVRSWAMSLCITGHTRIGLKKEFEWNSHAGNGIGVMVPKPHFCHYLHVLPQDLVFKKVLIFGIKMVGTCGVTENCQRCHDQPDRAIRDVQIIIFIMNRIVPCMRKQVVVQNLT